MGENNIKNIMDTTMDKLKAMVDANIITGTPMEFGDITLVPVCRVALVWQQAAAISPQKQELSFLVAAAEQELPFPR